jgi:hypothetical protein
MRPDGMTLRSPERSRNGFSRIELWGKVFTDPLCGLASHVCKPSVQGVHGRDHGPNCGDETAEALAKVLDEALKAPVRLT